MFIFIALLLIVSNYVVVADMPENSKVAYFIVAAIICGLIVLTNLV